MILSMAFDFYKQKHSRNEIGWFKYGTQTFLFLAKFPYSENYLKVCIGVNSSLINSIPTQNDVKTGLYSSPNAF